MENASKALLMAGGVLIGLMILSLAIYLFVSFGADSRKIQAQIDANKLTQFNAQFTIYDNRNDITIYDIITVANIAKENNDYYENYADYEDNYKIKVEVMGIGSYSSAEFQAKEKSEKQEVLENYNFDNSGNIKKFKCDTINKTNNYHANGRIKKITFRLST